MAERVAEVACNIAAMCNPFAFITGGSSPMDIKDAIEGLGDATKRLAKVRFLYQNFFLFKILTSDFCYFGALNFGCMIDNL